MFSIRSVLLDLRPYRALIFLFFIAIVGGWLTPVAAQPISLVIWDFEGETRLPMLDVTGSATAVSGKGLGNETFPAGHNGSIDAWSFNNWSGNLMRENDYVEFTLDLTHYAHISLAFAERRSASGIRTFVIDYSVDDRNFTPIPATETTVPDDISWRSHNFDFGWDTAVDQAIRGQSSVTFRIYGYGAEAANGTWRFDDVVFSAGATPTAVTLGTVSAGSRPKSPAPHFVLLSGIATLFLWRRLRPAAR